MQILESLVIIFVFTDFFFWFSLTVLLLNSILLRRFQAQKILEIDTTAIAIIIKATGPFLAASLHPSVEQDSQKL